METNHSTDSNVESSSTEMTWPAPLLDLACAVAAQKYVIIVLLVVGLTLGIIRLILMPSIYTASAVAVLLPREKPVLDVAIDTSSIETANDRASRSTSGSLLLPPYPALYTTLIYTRPVLSDMPS